MRNALVLGLDGQSKRVWSWLRILILLCAGCSSGGESAGPPFQIESFDQLGRLVRLNEVLVVRFSADLDPARVNRDTFRVEEIDSTGRVLRRVPGWLEVRGAKVRFTPRAILDPSLEDGGFRLGGSYRVSIAGFPAPNGVRSLDGRYLVRGDSFGFRTVGYGQGSGEFFYAYDGAERGPAVSYLDPDLPILHFRAGCKAWLLAFDKALRPDRIRPEAVKLVRLRREAPPDPDPERWKADELIPLWLRLPRVEEYRARISDFSTQNLGGEDPGDLGEGRVLEIRPDLLHPPDAGDSFLLYFSAGEEQGDPGGLCSYAGWPIISPSRLFSIEHDPAPALSITRTFEFTGEEGCTRGDPSMGLIPEDGGLVATGGLARVPITDLAGTGADGEPGAGENLLSERDPGEQPRGRVHLDFTRLHLRPSQTLRLRGGPHSLIRCQGRARIEGRVEIASEDRQAGGGETCRPEQSETVDLEDVLERFESRQRDYLVVVAGGDLILEGEIEAPERDLLLVSPSAVKVGAQAVLNARSIHVLAPVGSAAPAVAGIDTIRWRAVFPPPRLFEPRTSLRYRLATPWVEFGDVLEKAPGESPELLVDAQLLPGTLGAVRLLYQSAEHPPRSRRRARALERGQVRAQLPPGSTRVRICIEVELVPSSAGGVFWVCPPAIDRLTLTIR